MDAPSQINSPDSPMVVVDQLNTNIKKESEFSFKINALGKPSSPSTSAKVLVLKKSQVSLQEDLDSVAKESTKGTNISSSKLISGEVGTGGVFMADSYCSFTEDFLDSSCNSNSSRLLNTTNPCNHTQAYFDSASQLRLSSWLTNIPRIQPPVKSKPRAGISTLEFKSLAEKTLAPNKINSYTPMPDSSELEVAETSESESGLYEAHSPSPLEFGKKKRLSSIDISLNRKIFRTPFPVGFQVGFYKGKMTVTSKNPPYIGSPSAEDEASKDEAHILEPRPLGENEYEVEMIIAKRIRNHRSFYYVKWRNYPHEKNTWEPFSNLSLCLELVAAFNACSRFNPRTVRAIDSGFPGAEYENQSAKIMLLPDNVQKFMETLSKDDGPIITVVNEIDNEGPPSNFEYVTRNVYSEGIPEPSKDRINDSCDCKISCSSKTACVCILRNNGKEPYTASGLLRIPVGTSIFECTPYCCCSSDCKGKVVQKGRKVNIQVFKTLNKGWGVRAMQVIPKNTFITEYIGEVITEEEADKRGQNCDREGLNYLFDLDGELDDSLYTIDGQYKGNVSHFFNHSCDANLKVRSVFIDDHHPGLHRLAFFSNRNIARLEELCINYSGSNDDQPRENPFESLAKKNYSICYCGALKCTGKFFH